MSKRTVGILAVAVLAGVLAVVIVAYFPTHRDDKAFGSAQQTEKSVSEEYELAIKAYQAYLGSYPHGRHVKVARAKVEVELPQRIDAREWQAAGAEETITAYEGYLKRFPDGAHVADAREEIGQLKWIEASSTDTIEAYKSFATSFPAHPRAADAKREMDILKRAGQEFVKGRKMYLYNPVPAKVTTLPYECIVSFARSREVKAVTGKLIVGYVFKDGTYRYDVPLDVAVGVGGDWVSNRRGQLTCTVRKLQNVEHVVLVFVKRMDLPPLSNQLTLRCTAK